MQARGTPLAVLVVLGTLLLAAGLAVEQEEQVPVMKRVMIRFDERVIVVPLGDEGAGVTVQQVAAAAVTRLQLPASTKLVMSIAGATLFPEDPIHAVVVPGEEITAALQQHTQQQNEASGPLVSVTVQLAQESMVQVQISEDASVDELIGNATKQVQPFLASSRSCILALQLNGCHLSGSDTVRDVVRHESEAVTALWGFIFHVSPPIACSASLSSWELRLPANATSNDLVYTLANADPWRACAPEASDFIADVRVRDLQQQKEYLLSEQSKSALLSSLLPEREEQAELTAVWGSFTEIAVGAVMQVPHLLVGIPIGTTARRLLDRLISEAGAKEANSPQRWKVVDLERGDLSDSAVIGRGARLEIQTAL